MGPPTRRRPQPKKGKIFLPGAKAVLPENEEGEGGSSGILNQEADVNSGDPGSCLEVELSWCLEQLTLSLQTGKLTQKQEDETLKTMKILESSKTPVIKKRQVMRNKFGDYRSKMSQEEKSYKIGVSIKDKSNKNYNSKFLKKSLSNSIKEGPDKGGFKFNFNLENPGIVVNGDAGDGAIKNTTTVIPSSETSNVNNSTVPPPKKVETQNSFTYKPSDNSFKFNFNPE